MKVFLPILFSLLNLALVGCYSQFTSARQQQDITNLPKTFNVLEKLQVRDYRNQDWCKNIAYKGGNFSNNNKQSTCNLFTGQAKEFDSQSDRDFQAVNGAITNANIQIHYMSAEYDRTGKLTQAEFNLVQCSCAYVYSPAYKQLPPSQPKEVEYTVINQDWYFVMSDWN
jgi:hypothetical protein